MSITEAIWEQLNKKTIVELRPYIPTEKKLRAMYIETALHEEITRDRDNDKETERFARLEADLQVFLTSPTIDSSYLFGLSPPGKEVWEIRSKRPRPSIRIFGRFSGKDSFVATHYVKRSLLGGWNTLEWKEEIRKSRQIWNRLFPGYRPQGGEIHDLVSGALDGKYFKN